MYTVIVLCSVLVGSMTQYAKLHTFWLVMSWVAKLAALSILSKTLDSWARFLHNHCFIFSHQDVKYWRSLAYNAIYIERIAVSQAYKQDVTADHFLPYVMPFEPQTGSKIIGQVERHSLVAELRVVAGAAGVVWKRKKNI